jgi:hypothetical protein
LISAGLFAAQRIHKQHSGNKGVAFDSNAALQVAVGPGAGDQDEVSGPVGVPSTFRHVHAPVVPAVHPQSHSTHAVALNDQQDSERSGNGDWTDPSASTKAVKARHASTSSPAVQHAADESDGSQPFDSTLQSADQATPALPSASQSHAVKPEAASQPFPVAPDQVAPAEVPAALQSAPAVQASADLASPPSGIQFTPQPAAPPTQKSLDLSGSHWPSAAPTTPVASTAEQVSVEGSNGNAPALTIVPGRPEGLSAPVPTSAARMQPMPQQQTIPQLQTIQQQQIVPQLQTIPQQQIIAQQAATEPVTIPAPGTPTVRPGQSGNVYGLFQDRADAAAAAVKTPSTASPFETLDHTKVMSFQFRNAPWSLVLAKFANATGLELRMQAMPDGTFNRWDSARYTPTQTLTILNSELAKIGCQAKVVGTALCVVPTAPTDTTIQTSAQVPASIPAAPASTQLPQFPGVPASAGAGVR